MLCEKILGTLSDEKFSGLRVDYVDIEWHEAFSRLHRKISAEGEDIGIRMGDDVLSRGLNQDDVLYADEHKVIAVNIPPCEAIRMVVRQDYPQQIAKSVMKWEIPILQCSVERMILSFIRLIMSL